MRQTKKALSNFRAKVAQATDGILGGFIESDGTVDFVPFTRDGIRDHSHAVDQKFIPKNARGGFSIGIRGQRIVGWYFYSALNEGDFRLAPELENEIRAALGSVCDASAL